MTSLTGAINRFLFFLQKKAWDKFTPGTLNLPFKFL